MDKVNREAFLDLVLTFGVERRFTQDTPILPEVWADYAFETAGGRLDLILTPHYQCNAFDIANAIFEKLHDGMGVAADDLKLSAIGSNLSVRLTFEEMLRVVLPMTHWWIKRFIKDPEPDEGFSRQRLSDIVGYIDNLAHGARGTGAAEYGVYAERNLYEVLNSLDDREKWHMVFLILAVHFVATAMPDESRQKRIAELNALILIINDRKATVKDCEKLWTPEVKSLLLDMAKLCESDEPASDPGAIFSTRIWQVNRNRPFTLATRVSRLTIKADAAEKVFKEETSEITWAIVDSGIDARHPAFAGPKANIVTVSDGGPPERRIDPSDSRVAKTYDFTLLRDLIAWGTELSPELKKKLVDLKYSDSQLEEIAKVKQDIMLGRLLNWKVVAPLLEVPHDKTYRAPRHAHGTHVAGILGANLSPGDIINLDAHHLGVCPSIQLYDLRVCKDDGGGDEFVVIAALQFIAHLNRNKDLQVVHGVNLSLAIKHEVATFACGQTPVCLAAERLMNDGVVVVVAAGNYGYEKFSTERGVREGYADISITDPGNAASVITVGSTHREKPHQYGVSYFSSRGPTGDGRPKPDLLAPGERIYAPVPGGRLRPMDGTSMAAPHVSGAAALLMARHKELQGRPHRIKEILCRTATDLGRERNFQGAGLVDILRALQSV